MKKPLLFLWLFLLSTHLLFGSQMFVVGEMFTTTTCPSCTPARSALAQIHNNTDTFPYFIPLIWQGNGAHISPNFSSRFSLYNGQYIPHAQWGGTIRIIGATNAYTNYANAYNQIVGLNSPLEVDLELNFNDQNQLVVNAETTMTANITTPNNRIIFILTYDLAGVMEPDYFASVKAYSQQDFPLNTQGQTGQYNHAFTLDPTWDIYKVTAVVLVQSIVQDQNHTNSPIHQAAKASFTGLMPMFSSNAVQGPPNLFVQFYDQSMPAQNIQSWEWDLNGDGTIDSTEPNPSFVYTEIGSYDVTLRVSDGDEVEEFTVENYIVVTSPDNVSGNVGGTWLTEQSPYNVTGNLVVAEDSYLIIEPGVEVLISNSSITIEGFIQANAEDEEPIIFSSDSSWKGLRIIDSPTESVFNNCFFSNADETALIIDNSSVQIIGNTFHNNSGSNDPGALKIVSTNDIIVKNNLFANNISSNGIAAMEVIAGSFNVNNNIFVNNTGHFSSAFAAKSGSAIVFLNNTVANNNALAASSFHIFNHNSFLQIRNCIIKGEEPVFSSFPNSVTLVEYSNITGGYSGVDNIDTDPLFEAPSEGVGHEYSGLEAIWYLTDESPCIDAGNPDANYNDPEDPHNPGYARYPAKGTTRNDMGAYGGFGIDYWLFVDDDNLLPPAASQNRLVAYPNPFNPDVNISLEKINFSLDNPISLKIYNIRGRIVKTLLDNERTMKTNFVWNGTDDFGRNLPTGVYLIRFSEGNINLSSKILLLK